MPKYIPKSRKKINAAIARFRFYPAIFDRAFCSTFFIYWYVLSCTEKRLNLVGIHDPVFTSHAFCTILLVYILAPLSLVLGVVGHFLSISLSGGLLIAAVIIVNVLIPALLVYLRFGFEAKRESLLKSADREWRQSKALVIFPAIVLHIGSATGLLITMSVGVNFERILSKWV